MCYRSVNLFMAPIVGFTFTACDQIRQSISIVYHAAPWWKPAIIYKVYPRSFQVTNGDGIRDINGIIIRLDSLQSLGVNTTLLTPIYPSPQKYFGYDIWSNEAIDHRFGTMENLDPLLAAAKVDHIRALMDMVVNHTSDQSPWFIEIRSSRVNPKGNWYIWSNASQ